VDAAADQTLMRIGAMIVQDERYAAREWDGIAVVAIVDDNSVDMTGFVYDSDGKAAPGTPRNTDLMDEFEDFRNATATSGNGLWRAALVQIRKSDMNVRVRFEYEDPKKWKVTPSNMESLKAEFRP
jgi:hypothetical protein